MLFLPAAALAQWVTLGPEGGNVRSLADDPRHPERIFLGTSAGRLFLSTDNGTTWTRFAHFGEGDDYVLDNMEIDPQSGTMFVGAWSSRPGGAGGDLFRSQDEGRTWSVLPSMHGKSIRALALAPSDPKMLVAGALDGVYRSRDGGNTWKRISPENDSQLRNVESLAIDPHDPDLIYVGTWHLGWKTSDGGGSWRPMKNGVLDDSDVFSIIVDYNNSRNVYLSACSGIYKSEYAAELFHKVQGLPYSARRTRILKQDPANPLWVYAGTTDGLWRTEDGGGSWRRLAAGITVNDIHIDPRDPKRILLATDRSGVLLSSDAGETFIPSNRGFSHRAVSTVLVDGSDAHIIYAGVLNDKEFGGMFMSPDGGQSWRQLNKGIEDLEILTLAQAENHDIVVGTNNGIFRLGSADSEWRASDTLFRQITREPRSSKSLAAGDASPRSGWMKTRLQTRITQLQITAGKWFAATAIGLYQSRDQGRSWDGGSVLGHSDFKTVQAASSTVLATTSKAALLSTDGGWSWKALQLPAFVTALYGGTVQPGNILWLATPQGALRSTDEGATWEAIAPHLLYHVTAIVYAPEEQRLLAIARAGRLFTSTDGGRSWRIHFTDFPLRSIASVHGRIFAATSFDGVIAQAAGADTPVAGTGR